MADKKPSHILTIPESLGRDVDKAREGKLKSSLPVESFLSDNALRQIEDQTRKAATPVHAENLRPISSAEAQRRTTFDGETLPNMPATRRVIPPPFKRPRIELGHHGKEWTVLRAAQVQAGDLVPDIGLVTSVEERTVYQTRGEILGVSSLEEGDVAFNTSPDKKIDFGDLSQKVAVGIAVVISGGSGTVKAFRERDEVRVFRKSGEIPDEPTT